MYINISSPSLAGWNMFTVSSPDRSKDKEKIGKDIWENEIVREGAGNVEETY